MDIVVDFHPLYDSGWLRQTFKISNLNSFRGDEYGHHRIPVVGTANVVDGTSMTYSNANGGSFQRLPVGEKFLIRQPIFSLDEHRQKTLSKSTGIRWASVVRMPRILPLKVVDREFSRLDALDMEGDSCVIWPIVSMGDPIYGETYPRGFTRCHITVELDTTHLTPGIYETTLNVSGTGASNSFEYSPIAVEVFETGVAH